MTSHQDSITVVDNRPNNKLLAQITSDQTHDKSCDPEQPMSQPPTVDAYLQTLSDQRLPCDTNERTKDVEKNTIFLLDLDNNIHPISWDATVTQPDFIQNAITEACVCATNYLKFQLRELLPITKAEYDKYVKNDQLNLITVVYSKTYTEPQIFKNSKVYNRDNLHTVPNNAFLAIVIDSQDVNATVRQNEIMFNPIQHHKIQQAIKLMKNGAYLIKHCVFAEPHLRYFVLSNDLKRLCWISSNNLIESYIHFSEILEIEIFNNTSNEELTRHLLTVKIVHFTNYLTISFTDCTQFNTWVGGLKALTAFNNNVKITPSALFEHEKYNTDEFDNKPIFFFNFPEQITYEQLCTHLRKLQNLCQEVKLCLENHKQSLNNELNRDQQLVYETVVKHIIPELFKHTQRLELFIANDETDLSEINENLAAALTHAETANNAVNTLIRKNKKQNTNLTYLVRKFFTLIN